ncbi:MAG: hypothetical protein JWO42_2673 [Chloroflexi bacterium]|jgi:hypothetical protein|nr:hypothetical protein [Chloroflexota bacterium]
MYPRFCSFRDESGAADSYFTEVAAEYGLGAARPGLAIGETDDLIDVIAGVDGRTVRVDRADVRFGLPENATLAMMDATEEAIEDALGEEPRDDAQVARLEQTLAVLESSLDS